MAKKICFMFLLGVLIAAFSMKTAVAFDPNWEANQKKAFEKIGLKPGDVINKDNWEKAKDCLPASVVDWIKKGEFTLELGEFKYDYSHDEAYEKKCALNEGKYDIGKERGSVVEKGTQNIPNYVFGRPYPTIDPKDPQSGLKLMHNSTGDRFRTGGSRTDFTVCWVSDKGLDRYLYGWDMFYYFWSRPDGEKPNPQKVKRFEITTINEPYDLAGNAMLYHYWLDGAPERFVQYIPALRRIKKMNVTDRSSPFFGTDFCNDDGAGFVGQPESMKWRILEEKVILTPHAEWTLDKPDMFTQLPDGSWKSGPAGKYKWGWMVTDQKYNVAWMPWHSKWVPRTLYVLEMIPLDPYYAYGTQTLYVDKSSNNIVYKVINDKSGAYWKTMVVDSDPAQWGPNRSMTLQIQYVQIDDKTHHASICECRGERDKFNFQTYINEPTNNPNIYKDEKIATMTK